MQQCTNCPSSAGAGLGNLPPWPCLTLTLLSVLVDCSAEFLVDRDGNVVKRYGRWVQTLNQLATGEEERHADRPVPLSCCSQPACQAVAWVAANCPAPHLRTPNHHAPTCWLPAAPPPRWPSRTTSRRCCEVPASLQRQSSAATAIHLQSTSVCRPCNSRSGCKSHQQTNDQAAGVPSGCSPVAAGDQQAWLRQPKEGRTTIWCTANNPGGSTTLA